MHDGGDKPGQSKTDRAKSDVFAELREQLRLANTFPPDSQERIAHLKNISAQLEALSGRQEIDHTTAAACVVDLHGRPSLYLEAVPADEIIANLLRHWGRQVHILAAKQLANK